MQRIEAALSLGARPRELEQAGLEREYQEWLRQLQDLGIPLSVVTGMATTPLDYYQKQPSDSAAAYGSLAEALAELAGQTGAWTNRNQNNPAQSATGPHVA